MKGLRKLKNKLAILMSIVLLAGVYVPVQEIHAAEPVTLKLSANQTRVKAGDTVKVTMSLPADLMYAGIMGAITYNKDKLSCTGAQKGLAIPGLNDINVGTGKDEGYIYLTALGSDNISGGVLLTADFTVKENASGEALFGFEMEEDGLADENGVTIPRVVDASAATLDIYTELQSIALSKDVVNLAKGSSEKLSVSFTPEAAGIGTKVTWSSSNNAVATVAEDGTIAATGAGQAVITAEAGGKTATCTVNVTIPLNKIKMNKDMLTLKKGTSETLSVTYIPEDTTDNKEVVWSSSDTEVASVDKGKVTAIKDGNAVITAKVGDKTAVCNVTVQEVKLNHISIPETLTIERGTLKEIEVTYDPENTTDDKAVIWKSDDQTIATVENGVVKGIKTGVTVITAQVGDKTDTCKVTVDAPLKSLTMNPQKAQMLKGESRNLTVLYNPVDTTDSKDITWSSSDSEMVQVAGIGNQAIITAKKKGNAVITATGANGITSSCEVSVGELPIETISLNHTEETLEVSDMLNLTVTYGPENTTDEKKVTWSTSDAAIATVDEGGTVTAVSGGTATITATTENGKTAACIIHVPIHLTGISMNDTADIKKGETQQLTVTYEPENTTDEKAVTWSSDDENVVSVDGNGVITGIKEGKAIITATSTVGNHKASCTVTVKEVHVEDIVLKDIAATDVTETNELLLGKSVQLEYQLLPADATDDCIFTWSSDNEDVLTIDANGLVIAKAAGEATITLSVETENPQKSVVTAEKTIKVKELPLEFIAFKNMVEKLEEGSLVQLEVIYTPAETTDDRTVIWSSSDESVATVENGIVRALKAGKVTITAKVGEKGISCELIVIKAEKDGGNGTVNGTDTKNNGTPQKDSKVKTGDNGNLIVWVIILLCTLGVMMTIVYRKRVRK